MLKMDPENWDVADVYHFVNASDEGESKGYKVALTTLALACYVAVGPKGPAIGEIIVSDEVQIFSAVEGQQPYTILLQEAINAVPLDSRGDFEEVKEVVDVLDWVALFMRPEFGSLVRVDPTARAYDAWGDYMDGLVSEIAGRLVKTESEDGDLGDTR